VGLAVPSPRFPHHIANRKNSKIDKLLLILPQATSSQQPLQPSSLCRTGTLPRSPAQSPRPLKDDASSKASILQPHDADQQLTLCRVRVVRALSAVNQQPPPRPPRPISQDVLQQAREGVWRGAQGAQDPYAAPNRPRHRTPN
jgi:hypothetical protein